MSNNYKIKSGTGCFDSVITEYIKSVITTINIEEIQRLEDRIKVLEDKLIEREKDKEKLAETIKKVENRIEDIYNRTCDYNQGKILYTIFDENNIPETYIYDINALNERVDDKKLTIPGKFIPTWNDNQLKEIENWEEKLAEEVFESGMNLSGRLKTLEGDVCDHYTKIKEIEDQVKGNDEDLKIMYEVKLPQINDSLEQLNNSVNDHNTFIMNVDHTIEDIFERTKNYDNGRILFEGEDKTEGVNIYNVIKLIGEPLLKSLDTPPLWPEIKEDKNNYDSIKQTLDTPYNVEKSMYEVIGTIIQRISNLEESMPDKEEIVTQEQLKPISEKLEDVYYRTQNYDNGVILYPTGDGIKGYYLNNIVNSINESLKQSVNDITTHEWYDIKKNNNEIYNNVIENLKKNVIENDQIQVQIDELKESKADKEEVLTTEQKEHITAMIEDIYNRTKNYDNGKILYETSEGIKGIYPLHIADNVNQLLVRSYNTITTTEWDQIDKENYDIIDRDLIDESDVVRATLQDQIDYVKNSYQLKESDTPYIFNVNDSNGKQLHNIETQNLETFIRQLTETINGKSILGDTITQVDILKGIDKTINTSIQTVAGRVGNNETAITEIRESIVDLNSRIEVLEA